MELIVKDWEPEIDDEETDEMEDSDSGDGTDEEDEEGEDEESGEPTVTVECPHCHATLLYMDEMDYDFTPCPCTRFHWEQEGDMEFLPGWDAKGFLISYLKAEAALTEGGGEPVDAAALEAKTVDELWDDVGLFRADVIRTLSHPDIDTILQFRQSGMACGPVTHEWLWGFKAAT